tara:strand:- start:861 stop:1148 length:288 start_codon:yes stop_codon:yes gene_type:complete
MTSPSKKIYYHTIRVKFKRHGRDAYSEEWAVCGAQRAEDIFASSEHTRARLHKKLYRKSKAKHQPLTIVEILDTVILGRQENLDGQERPDSSGLQ